MIKINATLIFSVLNFILIIGVLAMILWKPMLKFLDERANKIKDSLKLAEENRRKSEQIKVEHDEILKEARLKATEIIDKAVASATDESRNIISQTREQSQIMLEDARKEMRMESERIKHELRDEMADMTVRLAGKVLEREISEKDHRELISRSLNEMKS